MSDTPRFEVAICTPVRDRPTIHYWRSMDHLIRPWPGGPLPGATHQLDTHGLPVDVARNTLTAGALNGHPNLTHILWIDDDMRFPPDALQRLLAHDKDIVGGLCHNRRGPSYHPIAARLYGTAMALGDDTYGFVYDLPQTGLVEVDATGAAFLLVKVEVFRAVSAALENKGQNAATWWAPAGTASEDFSFCRRAKQAGYKVFIDCGLDIGHVAEVVVNREVAGRLRTVEWAKWNPLTEQPNEALVGKPVASIIIPTYNQNPKYLKAAVLSALNQTVPVEVIVVDDGTTDYALRTVEEAANGVGGPGDKKAPGEYSVTLPAGAKLLRHDTNKGISAALNTGIAAMSTDWFCWLSSDDMFDATKVERQLNATLAAGAKASFHDYSVIGAQAGYFARYVEGPTWRTLEEQTRQLREVCCINGSTVMVHRDVFQSWAQEPGRLGPDSVGVGFFDTTLRYAQDWEMWLRIGQHHLWHRIPEQLGTRREGENLTAALAKMDANDERRKRRDREDEIVRERYDTGAIKRKLALESLDMALQMLAAVQHMITAEARQTGIANACTLISDAKERMQQ